MEKKRSVGVITFSYFGIILGVFGVIEELIKIPNIDFIKMFINLAFILLSYNLLELKNWSRVLLLIINTIMALIISIFDLLMLFTLRWEKVAELFKKMYPHFTTMAFIAFLMSNIYFYAFLIFFTRPKVKGQFSKEEGMEEKKLIGAIIFTALFAIYFFPGLFYTYESFSSTYSMPVPYLGIWFWFVRIVDIIGLITVVGLFLFKDIFRKIAIAIVLFDLIRFIIETPFVNIPKFFSDKISIIVFIIITTLEVAFIYFFTRPKVKALFSPERGEDESKRTV